MEEQPIVSISSEAPAPPALGAAAHMLPLLGILSQLFRNRTERLLEPSELNYTQMALLLHLDRAEAGHSISELAAAFEIQQPGMSKVVQRLESAGAVTSAPDPADPRRKLVSISPDGRTAAESAGQSVGDDVQQWFAGWTEEEIAQFATSLGRLVGWLDANRL